VKVVVVLIVPPFSLTRVPPPPATMVMDTTKFDVNPQKKTGLKSAVVVEPPPLPPKIKCR